MTAIVCQISTKLPMWPRSALIIAAIVVCLHAPSARADAGDEGYLLPLLDRYSIHHEHDGRLELVEERARSGFGSVGSGVVLEDVRQVAVRDRVVFGTTADGYFILDASNERPEPAVYDAREQWEAALSGLGLNAEGLANPSALAAATPEQVLRPWKFRMMKGRLGLSDGNWSAVIQLAGLVIAFLMGFHRKREGAQIAAAVMLGLAVTVAAQVVIAGGGPGAFGGFIALPVIYVVGTAGGKTAGNAFRRFRSQPLSVRSPAPGSDSLQAGG